MAHHKRSSPGEKFPMSHIPQNSPKKKSPGDFFSKNTPWLITTSHVTGLLILLQMLCGKVAPILSIGSRE
jgi:hypothetical protein